LATRIKEKKHLEAGYGKPSDGSFSLQAKESDGLQKSKHFL